jgi:hypothetical protein
MLRTPNGMIPPGGTTESGLGAEKSRLADDPMSENGPTWEREGPKGPVQSSRRPVLEAAI